ncbi:amidohydrolase family protein [Amycolatopsis sp. NBC_01480]|uniref:amidohydrolase family protein n=1 Tax=Amycolatopsis sp. NBC_01480 TaxID=2903562 RepID=UPI002E2BFD1F|nr:amidohydrolase family protein [Amycolatopsis sp. NBC_01480]
MGKQVLADVRVFDGSRLTEPVDVVVEGGVIGSIGGGQAHDAEVVDGAGATLLPGLIDAHTHADEAALRQALTFGVTIEFDLASMPDTMIPLRAEVATAADLADVRSSSFGLTTPHGHPHQLRGGQNDPDWPTVTEPGEAQAFVDGRIAEGADYIKVLIEDGHTLGTSLPALAPDLVDAVVRAGHERGKMVLAHALTVAATEIALDAGADGLTHLFVDQPHTPQLIERIADSGMFVIPTLSTLASITGRSDGADLAADARVRPKLSPEWLDNLSRSWAFQQPEQFRYALDTVAALHAAGVDVLAGTDASHLGAYGMAHGASLHGELRLLVLAGFTPAAALNAATSVPAARFGLADRGRIRPGARADLILVDGDPTANIGATLSLRAVWRGGVRLDLAAVTPA